MFRVVCNIFISHVFRQQLKRNASLRGSEMQLYCTAVNFQYNTIHPWDYFSTYKERVAVINRPCFHRTSLSVLSFLIEFDDEMCFADNVWWHSDEILGDIASDIEGIGILSGDNTKPLNMCAATRIFINHHQLSMYCEFALSGSGLQQSVWQGRSPLAVNENDK